MSLRAGTAPRVRGMLLTIVSLSALLGCSGDDEPQEPPRSDVVLPEAPDEASVREQVAAGARLRAVPDALVGELPYVAKFNSLTPLDQSCVIGYRELYRNTPCILGDPEGEREMVLWGDVHASQWIPALVPLAQETGWRIRVLTKYGCPPLLGVTPWLEAENRPYRECARANTTSREVISESDPDLVLVAGAVRGSSLMVEGRRVRLGRAAPGNRWILDDDADRHWQDGLAATLAALEDVDSRVVVLGDTPYPGHDATTCLTAHVEEPLACAAKVSDAVHSQHNESLRETAQEHDAEYVDPVPWLCTERVCPAIVDGRVVYRDGYTMGLTYAVHLRAVLGEAAGLLR